MSRRGFHLAIIVMSGAKPPPPTAGMAYTSPSRTMVMMRRRRRRSRGEEVLSFLGRKKWTERTKWGDCRILARRTARWRSSIKRVSQSPQLIYDRSQSPLSTHSRRPPCPSVICFFQATKSRGIERTKYETTVVGVILYCERQMQVAEEPSSTISMRFTTAHIRYSSPIYTEMSSCFQGSSEIDSEVNRTDSLLESIEGGDSCVTPREEDERRIRLSRDERLHFYGRTERASERPTDRPSWPPPPPRSTFFPFLPQCLQDTRTLRPRCVLCSTSRIYSAAALRPPQTAAEKQSTQSQCQCSIRSSIPSGCVEAAFGG